MNVTEYVFVIVGIICYAFWFAYFLARIHAHSPLSYQYQPSSGWHPTHTYTNCRPYTIRKTKLLHITAFRGYPWIRTQVFVSTLFVGSMFLLLAILLFNICSTKILKKFFDHFTLMFMCVWWCAVPQRDKTGMQVTELCDSERSYLLPKNTHTQRKYDKLFLSRLTWQIIETNNVLSFTVLEKKVLR